MLRGCIGAVPNSHDVLIMPSSRHVSGAIDSPVSASDAEINTLEKRNVREECYSLYRPAPALQVAVPPHVFLGKSREAATTISSVEGLIWKIWVLQEEEFEMGGVYLFATRESAEAYLNHPVILCRVDYQETDHHCSNTNQR